MLRIEGNEKQKVNLIYNVVDLLSIRLFNMAQLSFIQIFPVPVKMWFQNF